jgi:hypothetical protein
MQKITVLARLRLTMDFSQETLAWIQNYPQSWIAEEQGSAFLSEFGGLWAESITPILNEEVQNYFEQLGVPRDYMPFVQRGETYRGSWVMDAAVVMAATVGTAYTVLKGTSELPKIADDLTDLKGRILKRLKPILDKRVNETLSQQVSNALHPLQLSSPPQHPVVLDLVIDARPLRSLSSAKLKHHRVHLSVGISRETFTLENLSEDTLNDVRIGLFKSETQRSQWNYQESYMGHFPMISGKQTVAKELEDFQDSSGSKFDLSDGYAMHVDCWISDSHGIYLFHFYLEQE